MHDHELPGPGSATLPPPRRAPRPRRHVRPPSYPRLLVLGGLSLLAGCGGSASQSRYGSPPPGVPPTGSAYVVDQGPGPGPGQPDPPPPTDPQPAGGMQAPYQ